jgi:hypothetical protein
MDKNISQNQTSKTPQLPGGINEKNVDYKAVQDERGSYKMFSKPAKDVNPNEQEPQIREKVVYKYVDKRPGFFSRLISCRNIINCGCLIFILLIVGLIFLIANKPANIWGSVVDFLNAGIQIDAASPLTIEAAREQINSQIETVGKNTITINEAQLTALTKDRLPQLGNLQTSIEDNSIKLYWNLDEFSAQKPLYGVLEIKKSNEGKIEITSIGTNRIAVPEVLSKTVSESIVSVLNIGNTTDEKFRLVYNLLNPDKNLKIDDITIEKDNIIIEATLTTSIF